MCPHQVDFSPFREWLACDMQIEVGELQLARPPNGGYVKEAYIQATKIKGWNNLGVPIKPVFVPTSNAIVEYDNVSHDHHHQVHVPPASDGVAWIVDRGVG